MNTAGGGHDFEEQLERELRRQVGSLRGPSPEVGQAAYRAIASGGKRTVPTLSTLAAAVSSRAAAGIAAATLVAAGGTAAFAATTHSTNPSNWGRTVTAAVAACKAKLATGDHGIGRCVSAIAQEHGEAQRAAHSADPDHGQGPQASPSPHGNGNGSGSGNGPDKDHPTGPPADRGHGKADASPTPGNGHSKQH
jgi:hypothetical protein